jgi:hypothetical protein
MFEEWYAGWQEKLQAGPILRWIVESRNRITKQGDLEIKSECYVTLRPIGRTNFRGVLDVIHQQLNRSPCGR